MPKFRIIAQCATKADIELSRETLEKNGGVLEALAADDDNVNEITLADVGLGDVGILEFLQAVAASYPTDERRGLRRAHALRACKEASSAAVRASIDWLGAEFASRYVRGQLSEDLDGTSLFARAVITPNTNSTNAVVENDRDALDVCLSSTTLEHRVRLADLAAIHGHNEMTMSLFMNEVLPFIEDCRDYEDTVFRMFRNFVERGDMAMTSWLWGLEQHLLRSEPAELGWFGDAGTPEVFDWLLAEGMGLTPDARDNLNLWAEHARANRVWALERLMGMVGGLPNDKIRIVNQAARFGSIDVLRFLAAQGVEDFGRGRWAGLISALRGSHLEVLEFLYERGVRLHERTICWEVEHAQLYDEDWLAGLEWVIRRALADGPALQHGAAIIDEYRGYRWLHNTAMLVSVVAASRNFGMMEWMLNRFTGVLDFSEACNDCVRSRHCTLEMLKLLDSRGHLKDVENLMVETADWFNYVRQNERDSSVRGQILEWLWNEKPHESRHPRIAKRVFFECAENSAHFTDQNGFFGLGWVVSKFGVESLPKARDHRHLLDAASELYKRPFFIWLWKNLYNEDEREAIRSDPKLSVKLPRLPRMKTKRTDESDRTDQGRRVRRR